MRAQLLPDVEAEAPEHMRERRSRTFGRLRGGDEAAGVVGLCGGCCVCLLFVFSMFMKGLDPNQYGIKKNGLTGAISNEVWRGGIHFMLPWETVLTYPAAMKTLEFTPQAWDRLYNNNPVVARTGAVEGDSDSGGQSITIACALQYKFNPDTLLKVYKSFGTPAVALSRFYSLTKMAISSTAQQYSPQDFWEKRVEITMHMLQAINKSLVEKGHIEAKFFQILKIAFPAKYERSITLIQVAEQQKVINENEQRVQAVLQSIQVMKAENEAHISNISSFANAHSKEIVAQAKQKAFGMTQGAKATNYKQLKTTLGFTDMQLREYFKIKAVQATGASATGKVVVGLPNPGSHPKARAGDRRLQAQVAAEAMANIDWADGPIAGSEL